MEDSDVPYATIFFVVAPMGGRLVCGISDGCARETPPTALSGLWAIVLSDHFT
eukprot:m.183157 g.183157  ORF g.183157 m.183157 type:complete len:53 (-) comp53494_c2_seq1:119-277(-)